MHLKYLATLLTEVQLSSKTQVCLRRKIRSSELTAEAGGSLSCGYHFAEKPGGLWKDLQDETLVCVKG